MKKERNLPEKRIKHKRYWVLVFILVSGLALMGLTNSEEHEILFEKAKFTMETKGDLKTAIKLFEELITKYPEQREYAAKSQLYIGICSEKLGLEAAKKAFQKVVDKYPDQTETVNLALGRINKMNMTNTKRPEKQEEFQIRKFWSDPIDTLGSPSPDGRYISYVDWDSGNLGIHDTQTGENRHLTKTATYGTPTEFAMFSKWSPDGNTIAYMWFNKDEFWELRTLSPKNPQPQILLSNKDYKISTFGNWSQDSKKILVYTYGSGLRQIGLVSVEDGNFQPIKTTTDIRIRGFKISPDGKYIAYDFSHTPSNSDISIISVNDGQERPLIQHPAYDYLLDWTPDGKKILFASNRAKDIDIWAIKIEKGFPVGKPELIYSGVGRINPMGFTNDGSYVYNLLNTRSDVFLAEVNFKTGKSITPPKKISQLLEGGNHLSEISPNGKQVAFISSRTSSPITNSITENTICIFSIEDDTQKDYITDLQIPSFMRMRWSPDCNQIFFSARDNDDIPGLYKLNIGTGEIENIIRRAEKKKKSYAAFDSIGKTVYFSETKNIEKYRSIYTLFRRNIEAGKTEEIYSSETGFSFLTLSPDNKLFAFNQYENKNENETYRLMILPAKGGEPRELLAESNASQFFTIGWTQDNQNIILTKMVPCEEGGTRDELWHVPLDGSPPKKLDIDMPWIRSVSVHPNNRIITFAAGSSEDDAIWIMENFLPKLGDKK